MILMLWLTPQRTFRQVWMQCQHGDSDTGSRSDAPVAHGVIHLLGVPALFGARILAASLTALKSLFSCVAQMGSFLLGWPAGSSNVGVFVEFGWPDAERISSGRLLSLFGRVTSMISGSIPVAVFQAASGMPGTWANCALQHVSLFARSFAQRVWCHIWITSICLPTVV